MILLDDLKTTITVLHDTPRVILQTSRANFQHFYVCDRSLNAQEQGKMQAATALRFGADCGSTGGGQPHRCPGSVDFKKGRDLFVTQLVYLSPSGRPLPFTSLTPTTNAPTSALLLITVGDERDRRSHKTQPASDQSAADWAWVMRNKGLGQDALIARLNQFDSARGKHPGYSLRTVQRALAS